MQTTLLNIVTVSVQDSVTILIGWRYYLILVSFSSEKSDN